MKQGNGSDLLGANDPRSATIGIIYVAPDDDRESVLAAILTQEKLGRKQIAIVLPNQNKAFQRPVDFDGLKNMRSKLQAQLVIVAQQGSGPADFARQRRFTYFTSLESYTKSLRVEGEVSQAARRGRWPFGGRNQKQAADAVSGIEASNLSNRSDDHLQHPAEDIEKEKDDQQGNAGFGSNGAAFGLGAGLGAAVWATDSAMRAHDHHEPPLPPMGNQEDWEEDAAFAMPAPSSPAGPQTQVEEDAFQPTSPPRQGQDDVVAAPGIITFPVPARARNTKKLPAVDADLHGDEQGAAAVAAPAAWKQRSGKRPAVVAGVPVVVPTSGTTGSSGNTGLPPRRNRRSGWQLLLIGLAVLLLFSVLLCGGIALAAPGTWHSFTSSVSHVLPSGSPTATVTITPKSTILQNTYGINGVLGTPDITKREVQARRLTFTTPKQSKTVSATGFVNIPGTQATGTLTFFNGSLAPYGVTAGTVFTDAQGVQIANNILAYIPAGNPNTGFGHVTVSAHAITTGSRGNIRAGDFTNVICCGNSAVGVSNNVAFSGGQDPQKYTAVQQSDIDNAATPFKQPLTQSALSSLNGQKHANEQFVGTPKCTTNVTSDHNAGDRVSSVTVSVTATCAGEVYDQVGARTIAANLLITGADKQTGGGYALVGNVITTSTQALADNKGKVALFIKAQGVWAFQFTDALKAQLVSQITGKTQNEATTLLLQNKGVAKVDSIRISSGSSLPTDAKQITIVVQNVPGLQGTPTGTPGAGTATPTNTLTSPVVKPSPDVTPGK